MTSDNGDSGERALVYPGESEFAILRQSPEELAEVMRDNLGGKSLSPSDLDRVTVPGGGGTQWAITELDGEKHVDELNGVILWWADHRRYYKTKFGEGEKQAPDCASEDCKIGIGDPGGSCNDCPFSQWGSGDGPRSQACKKVRVMLMLPTNRNLPWVVTAPVTSVKHLHKYFLNLIAGTPMRSYYKVVTKLTLTRETNAGGVLYSEIVATMASDLQPEMIESVKSYKDSIEATSLSPGAFASEVPVETETADSHQEDASE